MVVLVVVALSVAPSIHTIDDFVHLITHLEMPRYDYTISYT